MAFVDALGNLARFALVPGYRYETLGVPPLIDNVTFDALIADKAFDSVLVEALDERGAKVGISQQARRIGPRAIDPVM